MDRRQHKAKRQFLEEIIGKDDRELVLIGATRALSRLREIYQNCGMDAVVDIIQGGGTDKANKLGELRKVQLKYGEPYAVTHDFDLLDDRPPSTYRGTKGTS